MNGSFWQRVEDNCELLIANYNWLINVSLLLIEVAEPSYIAKSIQDREILKCKDHTLRINYPPTFAK